jgi:hypothetical protein
MPHMNICANTRRIRVACSNTAPVLPISSPALSRARICPISHVARFEWALNTAATVREASPLKIEAFAGTPPERAALLKISLQPSVSYFASAWPIDAIWLANQQQEVPTVNLASGGTMIEIRRAAEGFSWHRLDPGAFAFRRALAEGFALGTAAATAAADPAFDLAAALDRLFAEGLVVGLGAC